MVSQWLIKIILKRADIVIDFIYIVLIIIEMFVNDTKLISLCYNYS